MAPAAASARLRCFFCVASLLLFVSFLRFLDVSPPLQDVLALLSTLDPEVDSLRFVGRRLEYFLRNTEFLREYWDYTRLVQLEAARTKLRHQRGMAPTDISPLFTGLLSDDSKARMEQLPCGVLVMPIFHHNFSPARVDQPPPVRAGGGHS